MSCLVIRLARLALTSADKDQDDKGFVLSAQNRMNRCSFLFFCFISMNTSAKESHEASKSELRCERRWLLTTSSNTAGHHTAAKNRRDILLLECETSWSSGGQKITKTTLNHPLTFSLSKNFSTSFFYL
jgi:hypothetical protein